MTLTSHPARMTNGLLEGACLVVYRRPPYLPRAADLDLLLL
jgi:hypothetical protein